MEPLLTSKVLRAPNLKRGQENIRIQDRIKLERVLGVTVSSNAALDCDVTSELVAYPAGCTVVLFNPRRNSQAHVLNVCRKTVTSLALAGDGKFLVTGECGHMPNVRVWDISDPQNAVQIAEFPGHKYGINCVAFSPNIKYVVSVGSQHDMIVNVWDWRSDVKIASNKVSSKVKAVCFAENGNYFVTVGNRHVKFWYLEHSRSTKYKEPVPLMGRSAILGEQRNNDFVDVACGRGEMTDSTYAITKTGLLCEFNIRRLLDKWVELRTSSANCMAIGDKYIFIGCAEGIVRCFSPNTLQFITTLPRTHYLGVDVAQGLSISHMSQHPSNAKYPDAIALAFDERNNKLTCVYNDHSIYIWDVRDIKRVGKSHSFLYHSACIWGVEMYPVDTDSINAMPPGSFITCSSDDTIRVWNLEKDIHNDTLYKRNIYSNELLKVLYIDSELIYLKDLDLAAAGSTERSDTSYDSRNGVRSIRVAPDGKHLASGDRSGNIRIYDISSLEELCLIEAHDAEVLCLEYSKFSRHSLNTPRLLASASRDRLIHVFSVDQGYNFLQTLDDHSSSITAVRFFNQLSQSNQIQMVSCGADKSIIFRQLQSTPGGMPQFARGRNAQGKTTLYDMEIDSGQKHVLTACQDRNIRVYNVTTGKHSKTFKGSVSDDGSLIKIVLDMSGIYVATSCTDKTLCVYDYYSGECMATMVGHSELVTGLRFSPDCRHLVSASGDGCVFVWRVPHDMVVTMQARLAQQAMRAGKRPLQVNGGGIDVRLDNEIFGSPPSDFLDPNANPTLQSVDYRFSVGQLPLWAKKQMNTASIDDSATLSSSVRSLGVDLPKGRWAQRVQQGDGITVKSVYDSDEVIPFPPSRSAIDSDGGDGGSKDSSIDSGTETKCSSDYRRETLINKREEEENVFQPCPKNYREIENETKQVIDDKVIIRSNNITELTRQSRSRHHTDDSSLGSFKFEDHESTEHDGDVEDYSEGENGTTGSEKSHHKLMYYPPPEDIVSNQFTVNAMDVEELRRSQRRQRKLKNTENGRISEITASGSQDESDSEGGASTPSAERNPLSMLSEASSEGFDQLAKQNHREKYLKNAFESLSGAEEPSNRVKATSISSQFHGRFSSENNITTKIRNTAVVNVIKHTKGDDDVVKKREELQRRIEETRRKLQSVGYRSLLKSSQSISDLSSHIQEKHRRSNRLSTGNKSGQQNQFAKPINPCKPMLNPKPTFKSQQSINKVQGMGNALSKLEIPNENRLSKSPSMLCINEKAKTTLNHPLTLILKKTEKYKLSLNKANQSLPESPVCEESKLLKEQCKKNINRFARFAHKRGSCSYFIGLNDHEKDIVSVAKSFESLPAMNERNMENFKEIIDNADEGSGNFSDDSLEGDFKNPPRRCVSDYQINVHMNDCRSYSNYENIQKKILTSSQESILSNASVESFSKGSAEILDYNHYDYDRHSSASFFLSRRKMQEGRSQESILTDESDYQMFPLHENTDHQSTESVLTDDSDSLVKSAPLEMLFDSHYKRKRQNSETYSGNPNNIVETITDNAQSSPNKNTLHRAVFRSKSLQDTRINKARNNTNFAEDNTSLKTHVYCEFNFDNEHKNNVDTTICSGSETISHSNSLKVPTKLESMMILNDFVAHKPPKPKRNSSRTQSMRNRARPTWKYIDIPPSSSALKSDSDNYIAPSMSSICSTYSIMQDDMIKQDSIDSKVMQQFLHSANCTLQSDNNKKSGSYIAGTGNYMKAEDDTKGSSSTYGTIRLNGAKIEPQTTQNGNASIYENVVLSPTTRNNNQNHSMPKKNSQLSNSYEMIENKLAISNDDLLEAIEQLSMLSKSKEIYVTPKRNNSEKDNAKSNEVKADKERKQLEEEDRKKYIEFLQNEKLHILGNMDALKRSVAEIEIQEEEISRELELEKALVSAEYESESLKLTQDEGEKIKVQMRINELEREMAEDNATHSNLQGEAKQRVQKVQQACVQLDEQLTNCTDEIMQLDIANKLTVQQDVLESERKAFEDLEFHHLEEEASKLATREELQRYLSDLTSKIENRKLQLTHLESQRSEAKNTATKEARSLERQKLGHLKRLEEARNRVREINEELGYLAQNSAECSEEKRSPSREDFDRISRVTNDSPIVNNQGSLGRKTIESLKEIERNRQLHLAKQGSQVISEERRRVEELKRRVQDEVRSQWEERKMNCASFNSVESGEESSSYSTGPTESGSGSTDGAEGGNGEKLSPSKLSELTSPSPGPLNNSYSLLQNDNMRDDRRTSMEGERLSDNSGGGSGSGGGGGGIIDGNGSRPLSQTSSEMDTLGPLQPVKHREKAKLQRPLTRYLPIKSESLDLRHHIETAGHQLPLIYDVTVDTTSCSGYLSKMSKKFHHWNKRWFVFDRRRKTLSYYSDNTSKKARGVIYFQSIEEVYVDHMNTVRSPQPSLTFIVKTSSRLYHLMAPSPEAMRVWVDVVFTGAEGYHEFDHGV